MTTRNEEQYRNLGKSLGATDELTPTESRDSSPRDGIRDISRVFFANFLDEKILVPRFARYTRAC